MAPARTDAAGARRRHSLLATLPAEGTPLLSDSPDEAFLRPCLLLAAMLNQAGCVWTRHSRKPERFSPKLICWVFND